MYPAVSARARVWRTCIGWLGFLVAVLAAPARSAAAERPNIIWIWADNLAYRDLGVYGHPSVKTPALDRLAQDGARFTQYYVAHTVCSPSRAALLTGRQPFRTGIIDVLRPDSPLGLPADEITIAAALRKQGYVCAALGKWHLGDRRQFLPTRHGFDSYLGLPYSMDMLPTLLYRDDKIVEDLAGDKVQNITERFTDEAIRFVTANKDRPFFLYFAHTLPHPPINLPRKDRTQRPIYFDALEHIDQQTGLLLEALAKNGLEDKTLIFFSSDNGPMEDDGDTGGLRGRIRDAYEGGIRVPLIARWPGKIPAGRVVDRPAIAYDIFPTLVRQAGGQLPADRVYDGQDVWPLLTGKGEFRREKPFFWVYSDRVSAVRDGQWKLHVRQRDKLLKTFELYDVVKDPKETQNLSERFPEEFERLKKQVREFQAGVPTAWTVTYPVRDPAKMKSGYRKE